MINVILHLLIYLGQIRQFLNKISLYALCIPLRHCVNLYKFATTTIQTLSDT